MSKTVEQIPEPKICESCGKTFGCGANLDGCWCSAVSLTIENASEIKAKFEDCLCPSCLAKYATANRDIGQPEHQ